MILIFDLDDTLYVERTYVESGFRAVAQFLKSEFKLNDEDSFIQMIQILDIDGRGKVFNKLLIRNNIFSKKLLGKCLAVYRQHVPRISLDKSAKNFLEKYRNYPLYLVTDGNKEVQAKKIEALNLKIYFKKIFITHRYGVHNAKPSTYCFDLIRKNEGSSWPKMVYVGDNPLKDFVNLNPLGVKTIRVLTGEYRHLAPQKKYDANYKINSIEELEVLLREHNEEFKYLYR
jgi:putative hydrolase of the HAD superfamily